MSIMNPEIGSENGYVAPKIPRLQDMAVAIMDILGFRRIISDLPIEEVVKSISGAIEAATTGFLVVTFPLKTVPLDIRIRPY